MKHILEARDENERDFENAKQEEKGHENVEQSNDNPSKTQNYDHRYVIDLCCIILTHISSFLVGLCFIPLRLVAEWRKLQNP